MPASALRSANRIAVIDIGSNSIRLVIYEGEHRSPAMLFNEKVLCGLGRGLANTGRLSAEGVAMARMNLKRFNALAKGMGAMEILTVATAAVREAENGPEFVRSVERENDFSIRVLTGDEEARLSALGVLSAMPEANGMMGDLGGGSLELVGLANGQAREHVSLKLGPLRLMDEAGGNRRKAAGLIDQQLAKVSWLRQQTGRDFIAVGGAWRMFARIVMEKQRYPLHVIHHFSLETSVARRWASRLAGLDRDGVRSLSSLSRRRAESLPLAALLLERLLIKAPPARVLFSAFGLREGCLFDRLPDSLRNAHPLLVAAGDMARFGRFPDNRDALLGFMGPILPHATTADLPLAQAACLLSDIAWMEHPDYRAEHAFERVLRMPVVGLDHPGRVFLAVALAARHGEGPNRLDPRVLALLPADRIHQAQSLGLALRLAYALTGGAPSLLGHCRLNLTSQFVSLSFAGGSEPGVGLGEAVSRRLDSLAKHMGLIVA
jgi:exopolyphosphatase/guanosine-5'-triphosphate,3'-diphosphate pyrophosphatase